MTEHEVIKQDNNSSGQKVVTALGKFLINCDMQQLVNFLENIGIRWSISGGAETSPGRGVNRAHIFVQERDEHGHVHTLREYSSANGQSVKAALVGAMAKFFIHENHDFHNYTGLAADKHEEDRVVGFDNEV